ncbi:MAG: hypothetical protein FWD18_01650 [Micrococcales bacterium]|nr:hypothetical protein [Micrococcales bacterium]
MSTTFPGFGETAPLDLPDLTPQAAAGVVARIADGSMDSFAAAAASVRHCVRPVRLVGSSVTIAAATGEVLSQINSADQPLGVLWRPCGNRRADVCPACSRLYARDTFEVVRTGVQGGKSVPESVASSPLVFATLTAPSFGRVHGARNGARCRPAGRGLCPHGRPQWCNTQHTDTDPTGGAPFCEDCYDWTSAVVWQWWAPELWRRFTIALRRSLAARLSVPQSQLRQVASVQFAKVAEFQARGLVHFHALIRADGPDGPGSPSPVDGITLADLVRTAAAQVSYDAPPVDDADTGRTLRFGRQIDVRTVRAGIGPADLTGEAVAAYLAKYATKSATTDTGTRAHLTRLRFWCYLLAERATTACRTTGPDPDDDEGCVCGQCVDSPYRLLRRWAHMLGFRGHFATKSRRYSVTLTALRRARARFQRFRAAGVRIDTADLEARLMADDETTLVIGTWAYVGTGWTNPGDTALALAAAARAREYAQWRAQQQQETTRTER